MSTKNRVHLVYTLQIKVNGTKQSGEPQIDDLVDSIDGTLKNWFPKGEVELVKHNVADGTKRVIITNVLPVVKPRSTAAAPQTATEPAAQQRVGHPYSYSTNNSGIVTSIVGDLAAAEADGFVINEQEPLAGKTEAGEGDLSE